jgi:putative ABC transport system permease protein
MIWTIAWRNVWRNKKRTGVLIGAILFGVWAGLVQIALSNGMARQQVEAAISTRTSEIQIHSKGFREHMNVNLVIPGGEGVLERVRSAPEVSAAAGRVVVNGMASSATSGRGVKIYGVAPADERRLTDVYTRVVDGTYFDTRRRNPAVIGTALAEKLGVELGKKIVLTSQATDGSIAAGAFRVVGLFKTADSGFDETAVFAVRGDVARIFGLGESLHEIALNVKDISGIGPAAAALARENPGLEVATWKQLSPDVAITQESTQQMNDIFLAVILAALVFGITNTMLMGVLERTRELGVVIALGMRHGPLFATVLLETVLVSLIGGVAGVALGAGTIGILGRTGIDLSIVSSGLAALGLDKVIYPTMPAAQYPGVVLMVIITAIVASVYPGLKAVRLNPAEAIRTY